MWVKASVRPGSRRVSLFTGVSYSFRHSVAYGYLRYRDGEFRVDNTLYSFYYILGKDRFDVTDRGGWR